MHVSLDTAGLSEESWPQNVSETIYRILQEALTNIIRHAHASHAVAIISNDETHLYLTITDDGQFTGNLTYGFGLTGMKERAEKAGGSLSLSTVRPSGLQIELALPLMTTNKEQKMNKDKIRVALADDQPLVREGFRYVINAQPDMTVSGEAGDGHGIIALAKQTKPDVILMDVQMPHCSGIEAAKDIMSTLPYTKIVILTTFDTEEYVFEGIRAGAVGYLLKDTLPEELIDAIRAAARGEAIFRTATGAKIISETFRSKQQTQAEELAEPFTKENSRFFSKWPMG